jgi:putative SOS response-associated peptidase YedK
MSINLVRTMVSSRQPLAYETSKTVHQPSTINHQPSTLMCFYYSINKPNADKMVKKGILSNNQLDKISNKTLANGFERPVMPVVSNLEPNNISYYQWGLVPSTVTSNVEANQFLKSYNTLNAKSENIFKSKVYATPILTQRCLVLASGFFEWQHFRGKKYPYYITLNNNSLFAFAGIWDKWIDENGNATHTYSILTTEANELMAKGCL